jgi:hypothetical protein
MDAVSVAVEKAVSAPVDATETLLPEEPEPV